MAQDFEALTQRPENRARRLELVGGEVVEMVSSGYASEIAARILTWLNLYVMQHHLGRVTGADGGYVVGDDRYIPDVAFVSATRQAQRSEHAYNPIAPDVAVKVISPTDSPQQVTRKAINYLLAETVVWLVYPDTRTVDVLTPHEAPRTLRMGDNIIGTGALEGFILPLSDIFPTEN